jgi:hypothetical protein
MSPCRTLFAGMGRTSGEKRVLVSDLRRKPCAKAMTFKVAEVVKIVAKDREKMATPDTASSPARRIDNQHDLWVRGG